jgi:hypothetical protein
MTRDETRMKFGKTVSLVPNAPELLTSPRREPNIPYRVLMDVWRNHVSHFLLKGTLDHLLVAR